METTNTNFSSVYECFLGKITDDMYLEMTPENTLADLQNLLTNAIPNFEFPRKNINDYIIDPEDIPTTTNDMDNPLSNINSHFNVNLSQEEINILATLMMISWLQRQIVSIENIRMKYSGSDFKFTS